MNLNIVNLGTISYKDALDIQTKLLEKRQNGEIDNTLLLLEHHPVLTLGVRGQYNNIYLSSQELKEKGVEIFEINRGGDVTFHGYGQLVGYCIFDLKDVEKNMRTFIQKIQNSIINLLNDKFAIKAEMGKDKMTGVWVNDKKIMAVGIAVSKWVTMHGFAFNVNTDLDCFKWINPCGLSKGVTSVKEHTGKEIDFNKMIELVKQYFIREFDCTGIDKNLSDLI